MGLAVARPSEGWSVRGLVPSEGSSFRGLATSHTHLWIVNDVRIRFLEMTGRRQTGVAFQRDPRYTGWKQLEACTTLDY